MSSLVVLVGTSILFPFSYAGAGQNMAANKYSPLFPSRILPSKLMKCYFEVVYLIGKLLYYTDLNIFSMTKYRLCRHNASVYYGGEEADKQKVKVENTCFCSTKFYFLIFVASPNFFHRINHFS